MKVESREAVNSTVSHPWVVTACVMFGLGFIALAAFWIRKCRMFNLYQSINKKDEENKDSNVIGHERWYQERSSRSSLKKKKRPPRRTRSSAEFSASSLSAAKRRDDFRNRSHSSEGKSVESEKGPSRNDSFAKIFRRRSSTGSKHEYSALTTDSGHEKIKALEKQQTYSEEFYICNQYLSNNDRYELMYQISDIGSRPDKQWFIIQDTTLATERLLLVTPLPPTCPLRPTDPTREVVRELFAGLQHPYIYPVLDIEFWGSSAALISPLNSKGSLRDLIYGAEWTDVFGKKYSGKGEGLSIRTVQCLGRQILEGLLFLHNRRFPPFYHLHSGNVIIQHGVARLAGLENALLGLPPRTPALPESRAFGHLLYEMSAGYELRAPPTPAHLQLELERVPKLTEVLELIFAEGRSVSLEELACCELFRGVELRELRGANFVQYINSPNVTELLDSVRNPIPPSPLRRKDIVVIIEDRRLEDIQEEDIEDSDCQGCR